MTDLAEPVADGGELEGGASAEAEAAVRRYLMFLDDPAQLVDQAEIQRLEAAVAAAIDPIEKLKALTQLEQARTVDGEQVTIDFIRHAKTWADAHAISANSFRQLGVDDTLLRAAGIARSARGREGRAGAPIRALHERAVTAHEIQRTVSGWSGQFLLADIATKIGGSPMTIRKAVEELVSSGRVRRLGPISGHIGPGRAPIAFEVVRS